MAAVREVLFRKSRVLVPADAGKSVEVPPAGIWMAHHDDTHPLAWSQRQRRLRLEQAILVKGLDCSHSFDDSTATGATSSGTGPRRLVASDGHTTHTRRPKRRRSRPPRPAPCA